MIRFSRAIVKVDEASTGAIAPKKEKKLWCFILEKNGEADFADDI